MATCKGCGASIIFMQTPEGALRPVDAAVTTIVVEEQVAADNTRTCSRPIRGHVPHHITCPNAADFRRRSGHGKPTTSR